MAKPILSPISVFDAAEGTTAYFKVAGAAVGKDTVFYLYEIYDSMTNLLVCTKSKYSLQGTTQGNGLTGGVPPVRFSM